MNLHPSHLQVTRNPPGANVNYLQRQKKRRPERRGSVPLSQCVSQFVKREVVITTCSAHCDTCWSVGYFYCHPIIKVSQLLRPAQ